MAADVVFELCRVESVESSTGDVANSIVVDNWFTRESLRKTF